MTSFTLICFSCCLFRLARVKINVTAQSSTFGKPRKLMKYIGELKHFTLYAFKVEAVVLKNEGAKSEMMFIHTKENG